MTNPLIAKWEELNKKKEPPKLPKIEDYAGEKTIADELKERKVISVSNASVSNASVSYNPKPPSLITHDIDSINDSFLQIAEKVKNKKAQVVSMNMEMGHPIGKCLIPKTLTFEVIVYEDTP
jgi:uncharacterized membrane-anchored protein